MSLPRALSARAALAASTRWSTSSYRACSIVVTHFAPRVSVNSWSRNTRACGQSRVRTTAEETSVEKGCADTLTKNLLVIAALQSAGGAQAVLVLRLFLRLEATGHTVSLLVSPVSPIRDAKLQLQQEHPNYIARLQVWSVASLSANVGAQPSATDDESINIELDSARSIASYGLTSGITVNFRVLEDIPDGSFLRTFGAYGSGAGQCNYPQDVCASLDQQVICVSDTANCCLKLVRRLDLTPMLTIGVGELHQPHGACFALNRERLFVADTNNDRVCVFRVSDGVFEQTFGSRGNGPGQFMQPEGVCLSANGNCLFVVDSRNDRIQVMRALDGTFMYTIGAAGTDAGQFHNPGGVCLSVNGQLLFVADRCNRRVQVVRVSDGAHVLTIGSGGDGDGSGRFLYPARVCIRNEWLFVSDSYKHCVDVFRASNGQYMRSIGSVGFAESKLQVPAGVCAVGDDLLVADAYNHRVQVFSAVHR